MSSTNTGDRRVRVLVLDDHPVVVEGLRRVLEPHDDMEIVGEALTIGQAIEMSVQPDVVVADLILGDTRAAELVTVLRARFASAAILVLSAVDNTAEVTAALDAGARGYLVKDAAAVELVDAVRRVARGEKYLQPSMGAAVARVGASGSPQGLVATLSEREQEIARLLALGHTNTEIADLLAVSVRRLETDRAHLFDKLGIQTRAELVRIAIESGLVNL